MNIRIILYASAAKGGKKIEYFEANETSKNFPGEGGNM